LGYKNDIKLEQEFARIIKSILGNQFITQDRDADLFQATDFLVLTFRQFKVAVRLRRFNEHYGRYKNEFTVRWTRPSGTKTEIDKIREGGADYLLYGFVIPEERKIISYFIADLLVFRACNPKPIQVFQNKPPDSELAVFNLDHLPKNFIKKSYTVSDAEIARYLKRGGSNGTHSSGSKQKNQMPALW